MLSLIHEDSGWSVDGELRQASEELSEERNKALAFLLQGSDLEVRNVLGIVAERKGWLLEQADVIDVIYKAEKVWKRSVLAPLNTAQHGVEWVNKLDGRPLRM